MGYIYMNVDIIINQLFYYHLYMLRYQLIHKILNYWLIIFSLPLFLIKHLDQLYFILIMDIYMCHYINLIMVIMQSNYLHLIYIINLIMII